MRSQLGAWVSVILPLLGGASDVATAEGLPLNLRGEEVVVFMGGADMVRLQEDGRLETALAHYWREASPLFRDLAWQGDTVRHLSTVEERWREEAFGNLQEQLERVDADVVIAQFGKMESFEGEAGLRRFTEDYRKLLAELRAEGRQVVVLAPLPFAWPEAGSRAALPAYTAAISRLMAEEGIAFIRTDQNDPVAGYIEGLTGSKEAAAADFAQLRTLVREKHRLWKHYWRPANWKCIFGDDKKRVFSKAAHGRPSIQEEWATYPALIRELEVAIRNGTRWDAPLPPPRTGSSEADIAKELASFDVLDGFEVNLFADESLGVANPLSVRWDASGRMYVACSDAYPQIEPGVRGNDRIVALRDIDGDGKADQSQVFADGLLIPTGMEVGPEAVWVGQGTELLTLRDTDGDGVADERKLLLSGFGNGDSHQTSNSFVWSPGGELWFCQGDGIESRVETPFGVSSLFQAGVFRLRPQELRLDGLLDDFMGPGNPWGVAFDDFGQSFVIDGAGGVSYLTPGSIPVKRRLRLPRIGDPGGYCGIECIGARSWPDEMQGQFLVGDYKKNQISRFQTEEDGAGFALAWKEPLLRSSHRNFRPIDVKMGPDGAIYVVDWYNPITCHQDDFYRHPDRDKTHGRIWRIAPKAGGLALPSLVGASDDDLLNALAAPERWTRHKAKQVLATRSPEDIMPAVKTWFADSADRRSPRDIVEALALLEWLDHPDAEVLDRAGRSPDHRVRAYSARVTGRWGSRLLRAHERLLALAEDHHPLVRFEAILAAAQIRDAKSILVVAQALEAPRDRWIDYGFRQAAHHLRDEWVPALKAGALDFANRSQGLALLLATEDSREVLGEVRVILRADAIDEASREALLLALVAAGDENDLQEFLLDKRCEEDVLRALQQRKRPGFDVLPLLDQALSQPSVPVKIAALELVASWDVKARVGAVLRVASDASEKVEVRAAALETAGAIGDLRTAELIESMEFDAGPLRLAVLSALLDLDLQRGIGRALVLVRKLRDPALLGGIFEQIASCAKAPESLAAGLVNLGIDREQGERLRQAWVAGGYVSSELEEALNQLAGVLAVPEKPSEENIQRLVASARQGDVVRGKALFHSARAGCAACHRVGEAGGTIGPDLGSVGSGLLPERIVTEVIWPREQVKEGYSLTRVTTFDGRVVQGYAQTAREEAVLLLRDFATPTIHRIPRKDIERLEEIGSLMPPTAQSLSKQEQADLLAFLFALRGAR